MKKHTFAAIVLLLSLSANSLFSQTKFGNVTMDELQMTSYANDTTASAVILSKAGETNFVYDQTRDFFRFEYTLKMRIKILKNDGLDWCNQSVQYSEVSRTSKEEINGLAGTTYNLENGKIVKTKLSKEYIFDENINEKLKLKKFTLPAAKVGSVIEYKYTIVSDFLYELRDFTFQTSAPVLKTTYKIEIPEYFTYNVSTHGYEQLNVQKTRENRTYLITYKDDYGRLQTSRLTPTVDKTYIEGENIPALKKEPYVWCLDDYITKVIFELRSMQLPYQLVKNYSTTWENIDKDLFKSSSLGDNIKKTGLFKNEVTKSETTVENASKILNLLKAKVKWNEKNTFYVSDLKDALKDGIGNSADANYLLINALKAGGFDSYPVILSTRTNGRIPIAHPSVTAFNYVITGIQIDTLLYFTDASDKYGDWNVLPQKCIVSQARMMQAKPSWVDLSNKGTYKSATMGEFSFSDSKYTGKITESNNDIAAREFKESYFAHKDKDEYVEKMAARLSMEIEDLEITGAETQGESVKLSYTTNKDASLSEDYLL